MSFTPIPDHISQAQARLIQQYVDKPKILSLIAALMGPIQGLEDTYQDLLDGRTLDIAVGIQLDKLGVIVAQPREGRDDETYRVRLKIRIVQNISQGEPNTLIQVYQLLTNADLVFYQEDWPAGVFLMTEGQIPDGQITNIYENIQAIACAGVRVDYLGTFDPVNPFCFAGGPIIGGGFGDVNDVLVGGKLATIAIPMDNKFCFAGSDKNNKGFGDLRDPVMGGRLQSL